MNNVSTAFGLSAPSSLPSCLFTQHERDTSKLCFEPRDRFVILDKLIQVSLRCLSKISGNQEMD